VEQLACFDEVVVWGHEAVPASDDTYSKGLREWISFAEAVRFMFALHQNCIFTDYFSDAFKSG
jgi:hypothetical protein